MFLKYCTIILLSHLFCWTAAQIRFPRECAGKYAPGCPDANFPIESNGRCYCNPCHGRCGCTPCEQYNIKKYENLASESSESSSKDTVEVDEVTPSTNGEMKTLNAVTTNNISRPVLRKDTEFSPACTGFPALNGICPVKEFPREHNGECYCEPCYGSCGCKPCDGAKPQPFVEKLPEVELVFNLTEECTGSPAFAGCPDPKFPVEHEGFCYCNPCHGKCGCQPCKEEEGSDSREDFVHTEDIDIAVPATKNPIAPVTVAPVTIPPGTNAPVKPKPSTLAPNKQVECKDTSSRCSMWQAAGFCENPSYNIRHKAMHCAVTCNLCHMVQNLVIPVKTPICKDSASTCGQWKRNGFCTKYNYMHKRRYCARTCGLC